MVSYYNEIDLYAAQWLRNLIANKLIADGDVDERSICDVAAADLHGYTQCHFFAGIGVWSHALRLAGWPDDRPVWTGSCPCQPFSAAGKGAGFADDRHLWPEFHRLIAECRPPVVFGEQVASKDGLQWLDAVQSDMEASGYAVGAADLCAAGIGAPHIRQRLWFVGERVADTQSERYGQREMGHEGRTKRAAGSSRKDEGLRQSGPSGASGDGGLADADSEDQRGWGIQRPGQSDGAGDGSARERSAGLRADGGLGHHHHKGLEGQWSGHQAEGGWLGAVRPVAEAGKPCRLADALYTGRPEGWPVARDRQVAGRSRDSRPRPTNGHWRDADWLHCRDGKWRPVEPGTFPLAHGAPARVGRLRAYGNAIVGQVAAEVIGAYLDARP